MENKMNKDQKDQKDTNKQFGTGNNTSGEKRHAVQDDQPLKDSKNQTSSRRESFDDEDDEIGSQGVRENQSPSSQGNKSSQTPRSPR